MLHVRLSYVIKVLLTYLLTYLLTCDLHFQSRRAMQNKAIVYIRRCPGPWWVNLYLLNFCQILLLPVEVYARPFRVAYLSLLCA